MSSFLSRLSSGHDVGLTCVALIIAALGAYTASALGRQAASSQAGTRARWLLLAVLALSFSIWSSSFITMLATSVVSPAGFEPGPMVASFSAAFVLVGLGAAVTLTGRFPLANAFGGAIAGLAVSVAHYVGMCGFRVVGKIEWDLAAVTASVAIGIAFFVVATIIWVRSRSRNPIGPIVLFALGICVDHLVAMNAATIFYDPAVVLQSALIDNKGLAWILGVIAVLIVMLTLVAKTLSRKNKQRRDAERAQLHELADIAVEGLIICHGSKIVWLNRSLETMLGGTRSGYIGLALDSVVQLAPLAELVHDREIDASLRVVGTATGEVPVRIILRPILMLGRPHVVVAVRDQRERLRTEEEMERLANTDALTELPNRARFNVVLRRMLDARVSAPNGFALLALDLDHFKAVNDRCGHGAGDAVLAEVGRRLVSIVRQGDLVARLGGDEFSIIARTDGDAATLGSFAGRVIAEIARPFSFEGRMHQVGVSIGIAFAGSGDFEALARNADLALYRAKSEGRNTYRFFEEDMRLRMQERHRVELDLRAAVDRAEFVLYYQPQIDALTGAYIGAEALMRWVHPQRGVVSPSEFIHVLEETSLISRAGAWALREACMEAARWPETFVVSVNVSPLQFRDPGLAKVVEMALSLSGLPGHRLELEITESILIDDLSDVRVLVGQLKLLGVKLSIDDFGTGYSLAGTTPSSGVRSHQDRSRLRLPAAR